MGFMNTVDNDCNDIELRYVVGYLYGEPLHSYKDYCFKQLKQGDIFRLKEAPHREMLREYYGYEEFVCASDAYHDGLSGWKVILED